EGRAGEWSEGRRTGWSRPSSTRRTVSRPRWVWSRSPAARLSRLAERRGVLSRWRHSTGLRVRPLREEDRAAALELCAADPVGNVLAAIQVEQLGRRRLPGAELLGLWRAGGLRALCWSGANLVPVAVDEPELLDAVADHVRGRGRRASSIVG